LLILFQLGFEYTTTLNIFFGVLSSLLLMSPSIFRFSWIFNGYPSHATFMCVRVSVLVCILIVLTVFTAKTLLNVYYHVGGSRVTCSYNLSGCCLYLSGMSHSFNNIRTRNIFTIIITVVVYCTLQTFVNSRGRTPNTITVLTQVIL